jgi:hypothetical protein
LKELLGSNALSQFSSGDPTQALSYLRGASKDVKAVGTETINGVKATHYVGTIDTATALAKLSGALKQLAKASLSKVPTIPFDAYLDDEGRLVRMTQKTTVPGSELTNGMEVHVQMTMDLTDFGTPVSVTAPPLSQTVDGRQLLNNLANLTGSN